jgi:hypothetical protein
MIFARVVLTALVLAAWIYCVFLGLVTFGFNWPPSRALGWIATLSNEYIQYISQPARHSFDTQHWCLNELGSNSCLSSRQHILTEDSREAGSRGDV